MSAIISAGIIPAAVEMMDALAIQAAEAAVKPNFPAGRHDPHRRARRSGRRSATSCSASSRPSAARPARRRSKWRRTKSSARASGRGARRHSPRWVACRPTTTFRTASCRARKLPEVLGRIRALGERAGLRIGNVFHAGDGNLHPLICYDERIPGQSALAEEVAGEILTYCVEAGGSITGEHGVGADKKDYMPRMFSAGRPRRDAARARRVRSAAPLQSRQGAADAATVRRGSRSLPRSTRSRRPGSANDFDDSDPRIGFSRPRWPSSDRLAPPTRDDAIDGIVSGARRRADDTGAVGRCAGLGVARAAARLSFAAVAASSAWGARAAARRCRRSPRRGLNGPSVHRHGDLTATVQAGVTLAG